MKTGLPKITLSAKIFLASLSLALTVLAISSTILYIDASRSLRQELRQRLIAVAATTATQLDADLHDSIRTHVDESSDRYHRLRSVLDSVKKANPDIRFIYTMRKTSKPGFWEFVVDAETDPKLVSHVGDIYDARKLPYLAKSLYGATADTEPVPDEWGCYLSGYAPIIGDNGKADSIVGVDMSLKQLINEQSSMKKVAIRNALYACLMAFIISIIATKAALKPIKIFMRAAERVAQGDLGFSVSWPAADEIGDFARSFNQMIVGLEETSRDFLTGLYNHMYYHERLDAEVQRATRYGHELSVLMIDLDRFKSINDTLGHPVGDSIVRQLASVVKQSLRDSDVAVRYGGDEFAVILPQIGEQGAIEVAERLRKLVEAHSFSAIPLHDLIHQGTDNSGKTIHLTVTIGVASYPQHHKTKDGLIMASDMALCRAKHVSRNSVASYDSVCQNKDINPDKLYQMLHDPSSAAVQSLAAAVDAKDRYTCGHSERVAHYAKEIAESLSTDEEFVNALKIAGLLHDVGKIGIPDAILNKTGSLTQEERATIKQHSALGGTILKRAPHLDQIIPAVMHHHERWDGKGYPEGLKGEQIPLIARIMGVADAFDAMTSDRPYRPAMSVEAALLELRAGAGTQFDPDIVEAFIAKTSAENTKAA
ncbi:MAG: HD domain-containing phosphohydrolase [Armatimonadota bacterium]|nr:diguanylate cyclase [bacterium]